MNDLDKEIQIDCGGLSQRRPRPAAPKLRPIAAPDQKQAPVALSQKPIPPPDRWDRCDVRSAEFGTCEQLRTQLIAKLEEALDQARGEWEPGQWDLRSPTWPWTRIGMLMLRCIALADALAEKMNRT